MAQQLPQTPIRNSGLISLRFTKERFVFCSLLAVIWIDAYITVYGLLHTTLVTEANPITQQFLTRFSIPIGVCVMHLSNTAIWTGLYFAHSKWFLRIGGVYTVVMTGAILHNLSLLHIIGF